MTIKAPRTTRLTCPECGHTTPLTTAAMADYAMRSHSCTTNLERAARKARRLAREKASGPARDCQCKRANHQHGTYTAYTIDQCRCRPCRNAASAYERGRQREQLYGRWDHYVDAGPARDHVTDLMAQGMGLKRIIAVSGISSGALWKLMYGKRQSDGAQKPSKRITKTTEQRILATHLDLAGGAFLPAAGTARRIQALVACGWSMSKIADRLGISRANFTPIAHGRRDVTVATAKAVADLYDQLWNVAPPQAGHRDKIAYSRATAYAKRLGWAPPLAWDDDTIDNPQATPHVERQLRPGGKRIHLEDVEFLIDNGLTRDQVAHRLGVHKSALEHAIARDNRRDLLERLTRNDLIQREGIAS